MPSSIKYVNISDAKIQSRPMLIDLNQIKNNTVMKRGGLMEEYQPYVDRKRSLDNDKKISLPVIN